MRTKTKLLYGIGVNDADYVVQINKTEVVDGVKKVFVEWRCPYYVKWSSMMGLSYNKKVFKIRPSYEVCSVVPEWHYFMTFRAWMEKQDWEGKQLDKDILFPGNKVYGPDTCVFVDAKVNTFLIESTSARGEWPIGVSFHKDTGKFQANIRDVFNNKRLYLGIFERPEQAHKAWLDKKLEQARILASQQKDPRVALALVQRYENYDG